MSRWLGWGHHGLHDDNGICADINSFSYGHVTVFISKCETPALRFNKQNKGHLKTA